VAERCQGRWDGKPCRRVAIGVHEQRLVASKSRIELRTKLRLCERCCTEAAKLVDYAGRLIARGQRG
jgi:hypothetical protein